MQTPLKFAAALALLGFCLTANAQEGGKMATKESKMTRHDAKMHKGMKHDARMEKGTKPAGMKMEGKKEEAKEGQKMEKMEEKGKM